jgi:hypothetical protein
MNLKISPSLPIRVPRKKPDALAVCNRDYLCTTSLAKYRYRFAQGRHGYPRKRRRNRWLYDVVECEDRVQLACAIGL